MHERRIKPSARNSSRSKSGPESLPEPSDSLSSSVNFELSRANIQELLAAFLMGAVDLKLEGRISEAAHLPSPMKMLIGAARAKEDPWGLWMTSSGPVAAWANYDKEGSRRLGAYLLYIEWCAINGESHSLWCHANPHRPTEWTVGRGGA
jgi:hypothetical protein